MADSTITGTAYDLSSLTFGTQLVGGAHRPIIGLSEDMAGMPSDATPALPMRQAPQKYTDVSFAEVGSGLVSPYMELIRTGAGQAVNQSAGNLVITTGTTANAETVIRSVDSFNGALTLKEVTTLSQRIANNNFFVELVDVLGDSLTYTIVNATTVDVTLTAHGFTAANVGQRIDICALSSVGVPMEAVIASIPDANTIRFTVSGWPASGGGTCSLTGYNKFELLYTGTTATAVSFNTRRKGWQNTAHSPNVLTSLSGHMIALNVENGVCSLSDKALAAASAITNRTSWDTNIPQPDVDLFVQLRAKNGTVAPATTTTWTFGMFRVEDYIPSQVSVVSTRQQSVQNSFPVAIVGQPSVSANLSATTARIGFIAGSGVWWDDTSTALGAAATFTGTSRDLAAVTTGSTFNNVSTFAQEYRVSAEQDVAGTLWIEASRDGTNWRRVKSVALAAVTGGGFAAEIIYRPSWRHVRPGLTNGAGAATRTTVGSIAMAN